MSANLRLIPTPRENGKKITAQRAHENDQNSNLSIHSYRVIEFFASDNTSAQNPYLQANAVNESLYSSLVMNAGGAAW